jgi:hypothetical protein
MPRSSIWPIDPGAPPEPAGELFTDLPRPPGGQLFAPAAPAAEGFDEAFDGSGPPAGGEAIGPSLWEAHDDTIAPTLPDPAELMDRSRAALDAGRPGQAAAGLALALRAEPSLAPTVLDLIAGRQEPVLALVRGDANRIVGHEAEALRDYVSAVAAIDLQRRSDDRRSDDRRAEPDESTPHAVDTDPTVAAAVEAAVEPEAQPAANPDQTEPKETM